MKLTAFLSVCLLVISDVYAYVGPRFHSPSSDFYTKKTLKAAHDGYRLPGNARPTFYDVTLSITQNSWIVDGEVVITLDVDPSTTDIKTNSLQLNAEINIGSTPTILWNDTIECAIKSFGGEYIEITCPESIEGKDQKLKITYETTFSSDELGLYQVDYLEDGRAQYMAATQLQPDHARRLFPCFDEPEYKVPIKLTIKTDKDQYDWTHLISNMRVAKQSVDGNSVTTTFEPSPKMSTYMLAFFMTSNFKNVTNSAMKTNYEFEIFARPEAEKYLSTALDNGPKIIDLMGKYTGIQYEKLGNLRMVFAAVPELTVPAMGNWGLISFREQLIVDEGIGTTASDKQNLLRLMARELVNQWFGGYVSLDWWSETWLNEGFAEFFEHYLLSQISEDYDMLQQLAVETRQQALKADSYPTAVPLTSNTYDINTGDDLQAEFTDISYAKGASIIRLMQYILGEKTLKTGLQNYLTSNKYKDVSTTTLLNTLQKEVSSKDKLNLTQYLNEWIYKSGYPLLEVSLKKHKVTIKASKFSSSVTKTEDSTADWWIPLTYTTSTKPDFNTVSFDWIHTSDLSKLDIPLAGTNDSWVIFNLQSSGFYRVNYDQALWERIINVLNNSNTYLTIDVVNRAQLLDDIFNVAKSYQTKENNGTLYYLTAFKLAEYLKYETEYHPWFTFFTEMQHLMELIQDEETLEALKKKILDVVSAQIEIPKDNEDLKHTEILKRNLILSWACKLGHETCTQWALEQYQKYKNNKESIDNNYRHTILCTALSLTNNSDNEFKTMTNMIEASTLPMEQADMIKALTCINDEELVKEFLEVTINYAASQTKFSRMFNPTILSTLSTAGPTKLSSALHFVLENYVYLNQYWQGVETADVALKQISSKIYSQTHVDMINSFITKYENIGDYKAFIKTCKEAVKIANENMEYLNQYSDILKSVIEYDGGEIPPPTTPSPPETSTPGGSNMIRCNILLSVVLGVFLKYVF